MNPNPVTIPTPKERRVEMFGGAHKGLRLMLSNLLVTLGRASFDDASDVTKVTSELGLVLRAIERHVEHEDTHLKPALARRAANTLEVIDREHAEHTEAIAQLRALAAALYDAMTDEARDEIGRSLYLHFSVFVGEALVHMAYEERVVQPLLERLFPIEELEAIHEAIVASITPAEVLVWMRAMIPAASREERARMLGDVGAKAPAAFFAGILAELRDLLSPEDLADVEGRLAR